LRDAELRERAGRYWDLVKVDELLHWDEQAAMPPAGAAVRARAHATVSGLIHEQLVADELGELLDDLQGAEENYDSDAASLIRVLRRARDKELRVPSELRKIGRASCRERV